MELTENIIAEVDTEALEARAAVIRDAVLTKSVTAEQVGTLFVDLIEVCGNVRDAVALFLGTNLTEIQEDIDDRLSGADDATIAATSATQAAAAATLYLEELLSKISTKDLYAPTVLEVDAPSEVTIRNTMSPKIKATTLPSFGIGGALFIGDNKAVEVSPNGVLTPVALGVSKINVVASGNTDLYEQVSITVVRPRIRFAGGVMRFDSNGNIRLT